MLEVVQKVSFLMLMYVPKVEYDSCMGLGLGMHTRGLKRDLSHLFSAVLRIEGCLENQLCCMQSKYPSSGCIRSFCTKEIAFLLGFQYRNSGHWKEYFCTWEFHHRRLESTQYFNIQIILFNLGCFYSATQLSQDQSSSSHPLHHYPTLPVSPR